MSANDPAAGDLPTGAGGAVGNWPTGRQLSTAARLVEHAWDAHLSQWGLNHAGYVVLALLRSAPRSQRELAAAMHLAEQTMSRMLTRLERHGHVARHRAAEDHRRILVTLTPEGQRVLEASAAADAAERLITSAVSDVAALRAQLTQLVEVLSARRWHDDDPDGG